MFCLSLAFRCGEISILIETGTVQAAVLWGPRKGRCVKSLAVLEHTKQRWVQGSALLLPAKSPVALVGSPWKGSEEEFVAKQLFFHM